MGESSESLAGRRQSWTHAHSSARRTSFQGRWAMLGLCATGPLNPLQACGDCAGSDSTETGKGSEEGRRPGRVSRTGFMPIGGVGRSHVELELG